MDVLTVFTQGMVLVVMLSAPALLVAVLVGVLISLLQALLQVQDQTLPFAIKLVAVGMTLAMTGRWIGVELIQFTSQALNLIATVGR